MVTIITSFNSMYLRLYTNSFVCSRQFTF
jgi:hypothetical protein